MSSPLVSVIIPAYNGAEYLSQTIQSVLDQTYLNFEIILVDDASTDSTPEVIGRFTDPRIKHIRNDKNEGVNKTRVTAIGMSSGEIIAWLDQDDLYHPEKLEAHVALLKKHTDVGMAYNARFVIGDSSAEIRDLWRPPTNITISDALLGFPIAPSDMVFTRDWGTRMDLWGGNWGISGGEIILLGRLILSGCRLGCVDRPLNYRRYHSARVLSNLAGRCKSELNCQETIFADSRCPPQVLSLRNAAFTNTYMGFGLYAFVQQETGLGQDFLRNAVQLDHTILEGSPCGLVNSMLDLSTMIDDQNHESLLRAMFGQLPPEIKWLSEQCEQAVAHGYVIKGARAIMWGRAENGRDYFRRAAELNAQIDDALLQRLNYQLLNYENVFGSEAAEQVLLDWSPYLKSVGSENVASHLRGVYFAGRAFRDYRVGKSTTVPKSVIRAILSDPKYLTNRGVISILVRSCLAPRLH